MKYEMLEEAGNLEIEYVGKPLDLYSFGVLHLNIQDIIDKVAFYTLSEAGLLEPSWRRQKYLPTRVPSAYRRLLRAEIRTLKVGSLSESIIFGAISVLADSNVRAVLQNLLSNIIWAIGVSGVKGIIQKNVSPSEIGPRKHRTDPCEIGPNLRDVLVAIAENNESKDSEIRFRYKSQRQEIFEVTIQIKGHSSADIQG